MALWTSQDAAAATGGRTTANWQAGGVSIDTRTLQLGDLFVALSDTRDGHDFVAQALLQGASAAMVARVPAGVPADAPLLIVPDVLAGLQALAHAARARTGARVIGVTGSVGKTSTKDMLALMLGGQGRVHASAASYNNHWGVPLTLARMPAGTDFAVIEIGMNHPGEIAPLARLAGLHMAIITTVAAAHLEAFADLMGIAREKASIFQGLLPGSTAILPAGLEVTPILRAAAEAAQARTLTFGEQPDADYRLQSPILTANATCAHLAKGSTSRLFKIASPGRHFALNALAVLAAADVLGLDPDIAAHDLGRWTPPVGRGTRERIMIDPVDNLFFDLIDDSFNANPASMAASLAVLALMEPVHGTGVVGTGRRIAVLGDMLELGPTEDALHAGLADLPAMAALTTVHCVGPRMRALHARLPLHRRGDWVATADDLVPKVRRLCDPGDVVLVKGSKGTRLIRVVDALRKLGQPLSPETDGSF